MFSVSVPQLDDRVKTLEQRMPTTLNWRGAYDAKTVYLPYDLVASGGVTYYCIKAGFNRAPASSPTYWQPLPGTNSGSFTNPMTTTNDLILGGVAGGPIRLAKGENGTFLGVDGSGNVNYAVPVGFANPMTTVGDIIVGGVSGVPTRLPKGANTTYLGIDTSGSVIYKPAVNRKALEYQEGTLLYNGVSVGTGPYGLVSAVPTFQINSTSYVYQVDMTGSFQWENTTIGAAVDVRIYFDGGLFIYAGGGSKLTAGVSVIQPLNISFGILGYGPGGHSVYPVVYVYSPNTLLYMRPASSAFEQLFIRVTEHVTL